MTLTDATQATIARTRRLLTVSGTDAAREYTGEVDSGNAYAALYGEAQVLLAELVIVAERLDGETSRLRNDRARYRTQLRLAPDDDDREALREAGQPGPLAPE